jgi:hypothetical protein
VYRKREDFLETEKLPVLTFESTSISKEMNGDLAVSRRITSSAHEEQLSPCKKGARWWVSGTGRLPSENASTRLDGQVPYHYSALRKSAPSGGKVSSSE